MAVYIHKKNGISFAANSSQILLHLGPPLVSMDMLELWKCGYYICWLGIMFLGRNHWIPMNYGSVNIMEVGINQGSTCHKYIAACEKCFFYYWDIFQLPYLLNKQLVKNLILDSKVHLNLRIRSHGSIFGKEILLKLKCMSTKMCMCTQNIPHWCSLRYLTCIQLYQHH